MDKNAPCRLPYSRHATFRQIAFVAAQNPPTTRCDMCHKSDVLIDHIDAQGRAVCIECAEENTGEL